MRPSLVKKEIGASNAYLMFIGSLLVATGYGATFVLNRHYKSFGGNELDTGTVLLAAMVGTFASVSIVGWYSRKVGAANLASIGAVFLAIGFLILASSSEVSLIGAIGGCAIGIGWGAFYLAAPMALSQRVTNEGRSYWFMRFAAFQMAGIGFSPFVAELFLDNLGLSTTEFFYYVSLSCLGASFLLLAFEKREPLQRDTRAIEPWVKSLPRILASPARFPIVMVALGACVFSGVMTYQSSLVEGTGLFASTFFLTYAVTVVFARWTLAELISRLPSSGTVPALLVAMVLGTTLIFWFEFGVAAQVLAAALLGLGYGLVYPLIQAQAVNDISDPADQNAALTWFVFSYFIGVFGFPLLGGWIIVAFGKTALISVVVLLGSIECLFALLRNRSVLTSQALSKT
ncbi:MFS transporter [Pseudovibrio japonicus]|uniref:MFS transporter n=1 Tax=Pseudovibrio japonicus TaxID=366534 RepID=UPI0016760EDC|nr:MFS transporter [Pseudovibrio japonicus]